MRACSRGATCSNWLTSTTWLPPYGWRKHCCACPGWDRHASALITVDLTPFGKRQRSQQAIEGDIRQALAVLPTPRGPNDFNPEADLIRTKLLALEDGRIQLANRQREAELFAANPPGIVRLFAPPDIQTVQANHHQIKIGVVTAFGAGLGMLAMLLLAVAPLVAPVTESVDVATEPQPEVTVAAAVPPVNEGRLVQATGGVKR